MTPLAISGIHKNLEAFLFLITKTEGTDKQKTPYNELFGYDNFTDYSKHPQIKRYFTNPATGKRDFSTAAGRYQINYPTYKMLGMTSFTPEAQDKAAIELIKRSGAYADIINGKFEKAIGKTNSVWASLPGSKYKQPTYKMQDALNFIKKYAVPGTMGILILALTILSLYYINQK